MGIHGGFDETSMMLHLRPELVDMAPRPATCPSGSPPTRTSVRRPGQFGWLSNDFGPDGHIGDPTGATAERGKALFEAAVAALGAALGEVRAFDFPSLMQSSHPDLRVDGARLLRRLDALAEIGPIEGGGNNRLALTDADQAGRDLVVDVDARPRARGRHRRIGNVIARARPGATARRS